MSASAYLTPADAINTGGPFSYEEREILAGMKVKAKARHEQEERDRNLANGR